MKLGGYLLQFFKVNKHHFWMGFSTYLFIMEGIYFKKDFKFKKYYDINYSFVVIMRDCWDDYSSIKITLRWYNYYAL